MGAAQTENTLEVRDLCVSFFTDKGELRAVNGVSFEVPRGRISGIVGESGCGKSVTARAVIGLIRKPGKVTGGEILLEGKDIAKLPEHERAALRGSEISMVFQEPMTSLNPVVRVGKQVEEALRLHQHVSGAEARKRTLEMLEQVGIAEPEKRYESYPHELSGGLRQRMMIAMAMICRPKLLIADEPTTALDVTVEAQILKLMRSLCDAGTSILMISHNLGVMAQVCDRVNVMYAGRILEQADAFTLFDHPAHPYTRGLLHAVSSLRSGAKELDSIPGSVPDLMNPPKGCGFAPRCAGCGSACGERVPDLREIAPGHRVRCVREVSGGEP